MATLAAPIATSFNSLSLLAWLATGFLIGQAATQPLSGKLTDIFSRQWGLIISNFLFALGNLVCGFASDKWTMIIGRVLAGIGGGCLNSISTIMVSDIIPLRQRALWQGMSNCFWGLGNGLGGLFGGYLNDTWDWRMAFLAQVPLTVVSLVIICFMFNTIESITAKPYKVDRPSLSRVDFTGAFFLVSAMVLFLLGITVGGNMVPWQHPLAWVPLPLSGICICCFIYVEAYVAKEPILPLHFLRDPTILCACLTNWCFQMVLFLLLFYIPIYYRIRGLDTTAAGTALVPIGITLPLGSVIAGLITARTGRYKCTLWTALLLLLIGTVANCTDTLFSPLWLPVLYLTFVGLATGGMLVVTLVAFTSAVKVEEQALVTSLSFVFRSVGSVMGVAVGSAVYQDILGRTLSSRLHSVEGADEWIRYIKDSLDRLDEIPVYLHQIVRGSFMVALRAAFSTTVAAAVVAVVSGLMIKELKLHSTLARESDEVVADMVIPSVEGGPIQDTFTRLDSGQLESSNGSTLTATSRQ